MNPLLYTHPACLAHDPGAGHPESPQRLANVIDALQAGSFPTARMADRAAKQTARETGAASTILH